MRPVNTARFVSLLFTLCFTLVSALVSMAVAQDSSLPQSLTVLNRQLVQKENKGGAGGFIAEYIPQSETFDNWTLLFATRFLPGPQLDAKISAQKTAQNIKQRRQQGDPVANSMVMAAADGKSYAVDFLVSDAGMLEHNVWRFVKTPKGIASLQIARRSYPKEGEAAQKKFITEITNLRKPILDELSKAQLPITSFAK